MVRCGAMGIGKFFKRLLGNEPAPTVWAETADDDLDLIWRSSAALTVGERNALRDEMCRRGRWFPFAETADPFGPSIPDLDKHFRRQGIAPYLTSLDPQLRESGPIRPFAAGALVEIAPNRLLLVLMSTWNQAAAHMVPVKDPDERIEAAILVDSGSGYLEAAAQLAALGALKPSVWAVGDVGVDAEPLPEELTLESLQIQYATDPLVLEITDDDGTRALIGPAIPVPDLVNPQPATDVIGGLEDVDEEAAAALEELEWDHEKALDVDQVVLLADLAGVTGRTTLVTASTLLLQAGIVGRTLAGPKGQAAIGAATTGDPAALVEALKDGGEAALRELIDCLVERNGPDAVQPALTAARDAGLTGAYLDHYKGWLGGDSAALQAALDHEEPYALSASQLAFEAAKAGDFDRAEALTAKANELVGTAPLAQANLALCGWAIGRRDDAFAAAQEVRPTTWLGSLLECVIADETAGQPTYFDPTAYFHTPLVAAIGALRAGENDAAEALLRRCLALCPGHPAAVGHLALHLNRADRLDDALAHCDETLERQPHVLWIRAELHGRAGRHEESLADYARCLEDVPDQLEWRLNRITSFLALGRTDDAGAEAAEIGAQGGDMTLMESVRRRLTA